MLHYRASGPLLTAGPRDLYSLPPSPSCRHWFIVLGIYWRDVSVNLKHIKNMFSNNCRYKTNYIIMQMLGDKIH
jgi:hypothetical protein